MGRNDGVEARKQRIQLVLQMIMARLNQNQTGRIPLSKTLADIEYETGLRRDRIMEYASIGVERGMFVIDEENNQITKAES